VVITPKVGSESCYLGLGARVAGLVNRQIAMLKSLAIVVGNLVLVGPFALVGLVAGMKRGLVAGMKIGLNRAKDDE
jgi:hypothetical protein